MLKTILMVPILMGCALVGTVGMIKVIKKVCPDRFDGTKISSKDEEMHL